MRANGLARMRGEAGVRAQVIKGSAAVTGGQLLAGCQLRYSC